jgi:hypothetical protein
MKIDDVRETLVHGFIGGTIAIVLGEFHARLERAIGWNGVRVLLFCVVFLGIVLFEWLLRRGFSLFKIKLPAAGKVDGVWLHAKYDHATRNLEGGTVVRIKTRLPDEYLIEGTSYTDKGEWAGWFKRKATPYGGQFSARGRTLTTIVEGEGFGARLKEAGEEQELLRYLERAPKVTPIRSGEIAGELGP